MFQIDFHGDKIGTMRDVGVAWPLGKGWVEFVDWVEDNLETCGIIILTNAANELEDDWKKC